MWLHNIILLYDGATYDIVLSGNPVESPRGVSEVLSLCLRSAEEMWGNLARISPIVCSPDCCFAKGEGHSELLNAERFDIDPLTIEITQIRATGTQILAATWYRDASQEHFQVQDHKKRSIPESFRSSTPCQTPPCRSPRRTSEASNRYDPGQCCYFFSREQQKLLFGTQ